jgi:hypothetical protein
MSFVPEVQQIRTLIDRRLVFVDNAINKRFPPVLQQQPLRWISVGDDALMGLLFIAHDDIDRVTRFHANHWNPFPGLLTTKSIPAAFRIESARFGFVESWSAIGCEDMAQNTTALGAQCA